MFRSKMAVIEHYRKGEHVKEYDKFYKFSDTPEGRYNVFELIGAYICGLAHHFADLKVRVVITQVEER